MLSVVTDDDARAEMLGALDEIVLDGARRMLAAALEAEADAYAARLAGELDERALNGPHLVALVRAGARFDKGVIVERDQQDQEAAA